MTTKPNNGPYFQDQDGDTGIIGPGINADAPKGCALYDAFDKAIVNTAAVEGMNDDAIDRLSEEARDRLLLLMNLAYAEGAKSR